MKATRKRWLVGALVAAGVIAAGLRFFFFGDFGDCTTPSDCPSGQVCMELTQGYPRWWTKGMHFRACEMPCATDDDCPRDRTCVFEDHGPRDRYCRSRHNN